MLLPESSKSLSDKVGAVQKESKFEYLSYKFEFPGGKVESNETHEQALHREILEELDAHIEIVSILKKIEHQYPDFKVHITFYRCSIYEKESIKEVEHNNLSWLTKQELHELDWAEADIPIIRLL